MIKVKVFEGQNVMFRGVAADRHDHRGGGHDGCSRPGTRSGTVIVATITPDKLVRFWTSDGVALGDLDQVRLCVCEQYEPVSCKLSSHPPSSIENSEIDGVVSSH